MQDLILNYKNHCNSMNQLFGTTKFIFNERLLKQNASDIKYILVGDNPGSQEKEKSEYLIGNAGIVTRLFFEKFLVDSFDINVLCLNKTPLFTPKTEDLKSYYERNCKALLNSQIFMADLIDNLSVRIDCPVIIMGLSGCRSSTGKWDFDSNNKSYVFIPFFKKIKTKFTHKQDKLFLVKHFSRNSFFDDFTINDYRTEPTNKFFAIGRRYRDELFNV
ncbi:MULTISPECIES: hypothetical protein [Aeromonas]|uniref:hypothetical protein n=1 Tax=Aeromonas TaxID=642 RepID=UPI0029D7142A|nr:hypothetical protein [Aeromonas veronii]MDX7745660.1 hypothetical protein [Aeromonas veronii]